MPSISGDCENLETIQPFPEGALYASNVVFEMAKETNPAQGRQRTNCGRQFWHSSEFVRGG